MTLSHLDAEIVRKKRIFKVDILKIQDGHFWVMFRFIYFVPCTGFLIPENVCLAVKIMTLRHLHAEIVKQNTFSWPFWKSKMAALWLCVAYGILIHTTGFQIPENVCLAIKIMTLGHLDAEILKNTDFKVGHFENPRWPLCGTLCLTNFTLFHWPPSPWKWMFSR